MPKLRLGVIGLSPGNGHPFSWSAIFNGYDPVAMSRCPFPAIPDYLSRRKFPDDAISGARVTHVWTQDRKISEQIAAASRIPTVVDDLRHMIGHVDGILLARDDAANHMLHAAPFLAAGLPIYIDKPFAVTVRDAHALFGRVVAANQIFTCTALAFARELQPSPSELKNIGAIRKIEGVTPKYWDTYAVHVIEPVLNMTDLRPIKSVAKAFGRSGRQLDLSCDHGLEVSFIATGEDVGGIEIRLTGDRGLLSLRFQDAFSAFKSSLEHFVSIIAGRATPFSREHVLRVVQIIETGRT